MIRTITWYIHFAWSLLMTIPSIYKVKSLENKGMIKEKEEFVSKFTSKWALSQLKAAGAQVKVFGEENIPRDIPVVFISNHQGNFDIPILMSKINKPKGFIAKIETKKIPVVRDWMEYIHCVFMDRSNLRKSAASIIEGVKIIKEGHSLIIFPEGTRSKGGPLGEFKAGSFKLATKSKAPIVPITINGSYKLMEGNDNKIKPASVEIYVHPAIETKNLTKEEEDALPNRVVNIIKSKLPS